MKEEIRIFEKIMKHFRKEKQIMFLFIEDNDIISRPVQTRTIHMEDRAYDGL